MLLAKDAEAPMSESRLTSLTIESPKRTIAVRAREGEAPGLFWLGGFKSDMKGTKAQALDHVRTFLKAHLPVMQRK